MRLAALLLLVSAASARAQTASTSCATATAFQNRAFAVQTGTFTARFEATASDGSIDGVAGLSNGPIDSYGDLAPIVRFSPAGVLQARNGGGYTAAASVPYSGGVAYKLRLEINVRTRRYSAFVTTGGAPETQLASDYAFRGEQSGVAQLNNLGQASTGGSITVCHFSAASEPPPPPPPPEPAAPEVRGLRPLALAAGGPAFELRVFGAGFSTGSVVLWNGLERPTARVSDAELLAQIPAGDIASTGTAAAAVLAPGGGASNARSLRITGGPVWVPGYYVGWEAARMPPSDVDFSALDAIVHFALVPNANGTLDPGPNVITAGASAALVSAAHGAGKPALIGVGGWQSQAGFRGAMSAANRAAFVENLVAFVLARGYDGIDVDMEPVAASDAADFSAFARALRARLDAARPGALLTADAFWEPAIFAGLSDVLDRVNLMTYSLSNVSRGSTWHNAPVYSSGTYPSADSILETFLAAGAPAEKLSIGASFSPFVWSGGGVSGPAQTWTTTPVVTESEYHAIADRWGLSEGTTTHPLYRWDAAARAAYLSATSTDPASTFFVSYDDAFALREKFAFARERGLGGVFLWNINDAWRASRPPGERDLLLQEARRAAFSQEAPAPPVVVVEPPPPPPPPPASTACVTSNNNFRNMPFAGQTGAFTARFEATPADNSIDGAAGFSNGAMDSYGDLGPIVRFNAGGAIDARNGGSYASASPFPYAGGVAHRFRLEVSVPTRRYSAFVSTGTAPERAIAVNYAFRSEQSGVARLDNLGVGATGGGETVCAMTISPVSVTAAPEAPVCATCAPPDLERCRAYPNPWRADTHSGLPMTFDRVPAGTLIRIYSVAGKPLKTLTASGGSAAWDLSVDGGGRAASGYYLYRAIAPTGERKSGKVAIVR